MIDLTTADNDAIYLNWKKEHRKDLEDLIAKTPEVPESKEINDRPKWMSAGHKQYQNRQTFLADNYHRIRAIRKLKELEAKS